MPSGSPASATALLMISATSVDVPGCAGWPLTTTGQPAASALAVSPPAVLNASGKLEAPKTATGPIGIVVRRMSGCGGVADGLGGVDDRVVVVAALDHVGERAQLPGGARQLAGQAGLGQPGLGAGQGNRPRP